MSDKTEWKRQSYVSEFLSLKCSGDVLNVTSPLGSKAEKEITESMGVLKQLRKIVIKEPMMKYKLYDICAGNALTSVTAVFLLPIKEAEAIDIRPRKRKWELVKRFNYTIKDLHKIKEEDIEEDSIIIGVHACTSLSESIIKLYNNSKAKHLILMPCCIGKVTLNLPEIIRTRIGKYFIWSLQLMEMCEGKTKMIEDEKVLSPKNIIIVASK